MSPTLAGASPVPIADLFYTRSSSFATWSPDSADIIFSTDLTGRFNLWKVPVRGGFPQQLTQSDDRQLSPAVTPDGRWIVFSSDRGGDEVFHLYAVPAEGGAVADLTPTDGTSESSPKVSQDSKSIAFDVRDKNAASVDIAVMNLATRTTRRLTAESTPGMRWHVVALSRDRSQLVANRADIGLTRSSVAIINLKTGVAIALTPDDAHSYNSASDLSADGTWIALTTETASGGRQAAILRVATREITLLNPDPWEQRSTVFSPDSRTLLTVSDVDGRDVVFAYDVATRTSTRLAMPDGVNSDDLRAQPSFSPDGSRILFPHESGNTPFDYWAYDRATRKAKPVTRLGLASINPKRLPPTQIVHYRSSDGTVISALLWLPFNLTRDGQAPAVVMPHGGPANQSKDVFDRTAIALASRGYIVIAPNPRGSTGYGRAFMDANLLDLGGGDLEDEIAATRFLVATGYVDAAKIGITGGSYGGFLTLMALGTAPTLWAAGVEAYGIVNWFSMYEKSSVEGHQYLISVMGDPVKDKASYVAHSPLTYLGDLKAPLLVLQGDNDVRVPKEEAVQVVDILRRHGRTVEAHYYPDEGHGFFKRENQIDALERTVAWFDLYLKHAPAAEPALKR